MVRAVKAGTTKLTASDGKKTVIHTVTVMSLDNVTLSDDYKNVSQKKYEELFKQEIADLMINYGKYTEVTDRKDVRKGDKVSIEYVGKIAGVAFEGGTGSYDLVIGSNSFIAGFEEGLIGKENGTTVDLDLTFPDPYENNPDLAGKAVVFTVTIKKIAQPEEYNDAMVKRITGYDTVAEFEEYIKTTIVTDIMFNQLTENSKVENIPQTLKDYYYNVYIDDMVAYLKSMGMSVSGKAEIISIMGYTEENFDKMVWESVNTTIKQDYIFYGYCEKNGVVLSKRDYKESLARYLKMYGGESAEDLMKEYGMTYDALYESFLYEKVMKTLYNEAVMVEDTENKT
jgi:trigger factor